MKISPFGFFTSAPAPAPHFCIVSNFYAVSGNGDGVKIGDDAKMRSGGGAMR